MHLTKEKKGFYHLKQKKFNSVQFLERLQPSQWLRSVTSQQQPVLSLTNFLIKCVGVQQQLLKVHKYITFMRSLTLLPRCYRLQKTCDVGSGWLVEAVPPTG